MTVFLYVLAGITGALWALYLTREPFSPSFGIQTFAVIGSVAFVIIFLLQPIQEISLRGVLHYLRPAFAMGISFLGVGFFRMYSQRE